MAIAVIPARGGSKRIPRKNIKLFHGRPIIAYSIKKALASKLFDRVIVSTDDKEIAKVSRQYGAAIYMRDPYYAKDAVGTQAVMKECLRSVDNLPKFACCIYATSPLMSVDDLKYGYTCCQNKTGFALSVGYPPLCDAGQFYWGHSTAFLLDVPLISPDTSMIPVVPERVCDINTLEDWKRAEEMYAALK